MFPSQIVDQSQFPIQAHSTQGIRWSRYSFLRFGTWAGCGERGKTDISADLRVRIFRSTKKGFQKIDGRLFLHVRKWIFCRNFDSLLSTINFLNRININEDTCLKKEMSNILLLRDDFFCAGCTELLNNFKNALSIKTRTFLSTTSCFRLTILCIVSINRWIVIQW